MKLLTTGPDNFDLQIIFGENYSWIKMYLGNAIFFFYMLLQYTTTMDLTVNNQDVEVQFFKEDSQKYNIYCLKTISILSRGS